MRSAFYSPGPHIATRFYCSNAIQNGGFSSRKCASSFLLEINGKNTWKMAKNQVFMTTESFGFVNLGQLGFQLWPYNRKPTAKLSSQQYWSDWITLIYLYRCWNLNCIIYNSAFWIDACTAHCVDNRGALVKWIKHFSTKWDVAGLSPLHGMGELSRSSVTLAPLHPGATQVQMGRIGAGVHERGARGGRGWKT